MVTISGDHDKFDTFKCHWTGRSTIFKTDNLKCYICEHKHFVFILDSIIQGEEFSKIFGLRELIGHFGFSAMSYAPDYDIFPNTDKKSPFREILKPCKKAMGEDIGRNISKVFGSVVSDSLIQFLVEDDRRKLKKCVFCERFFVQGRLDPRQKYCSEKCGNAARRYSPEKIRSYMKIWRRSRLSAKRKRTKEQEINQLMKSGYFKTRKDAEEVWEADQEI